MGVLLAAFSEEHAARLTGVTVSQLRYWDRTNFFNPSYPADRTIGRIYAFRDIVSLRVLNILRNEHQVSLPHLRAVKDRLSHLEETGWASTKLWVWNKKVVWEDPGTARPQEVVSQQFVVPLELSAVLDAAIHDVRELTARPAEKVGQVEKSRFVNHSDPVIAGTRIRVRAIKRFAEAGYNVDQILEEYPDLKAADVQAALEYGDQRTAA